MSQASQVTKRFFVFGRRPLGQRLLQGRVKGAVERFHASYENDVVLDFIFNQIARVRMNALADFLRKRHLAFSRYLTGIHLYLLQVKSIILLYHFQLFSTFKTVFLQNFKFAVYLITTDQGSKKTGHLAVIK